MIHSQLFTGTPNDTWYPRITWWRQTSSRWMLLAATIDEVVQKGIALLKPNLLAHAHYIQDVHALLIAVLLTQGQSSKLL